MIVYQQTTCLGERVVPMNERKIRSFLIHFIVKKFANLQKYVYIWNVFTAVV